MENPHQSHFLSSIERSVAGYTHGVNIITNTTTQRAIVITNPQTGVDKSSHYLHAQIEI